MPELSSWAEPGEAARSKAAIALGSNLGNRVGFLRNAVGALGDCGDVISVSPLFETAPVGGPEQGPYLNAVVVIETAISPRPLMDKLHEIERAAGRIRREQWGPRTLDLDLVLYGSRVVDDEGGLIVPHPRFAERRFVLEPLLAAWPDARHPDGTSIAPLLDSVLDQELTQVDDAWWATNNAGGGDQGGLS